MRNVRRRTGKPQADTQGCNPEAKRTSDDVGLAQGKSNKKMEYQQLRRSDMLAVSYLDTIKRFEGFATQAKWDYAQFTNGYGTKAAHPGEQISREEADRRFKKEISEAALLVDRFAPNLDSGTRAALTSLTFNAGTKWMSAGLGEAIKSGNLEEGRKIFLQYNKAGGDVLPGLARRRLEEATWFGNAQIANPTAGPAFHAQSETWTTQSVATTRVEESSEAMRDHFAASSSYPVSQQGVALVATAMMADHHVKVDTLHADAQALLEQVILEQWRMMALNLKADPVKNDPSQT